MSQHREPEWNAENINKKRGDTTFKQCGWCEHRGTGSYRYGCMLSGYCDLMKSYGENRDREWDSACHILSLGIEDIHSIIRQKGFRLEKKRNAITKLKKEIKVLKTLKPKKQPPLPDSRIHDYYNIGDIVFIFHEEKWGRGVVVSGYRHHDGCVSYVLDDYPESKGGWGCGCAVPCVLHEWEYKYFKNNVPKFIEWLKFSDRKYNGEKLNFEAYIKAIA